MNKGLTAAIAWRYLRSKKSMSAVAAISIISLCGMAVATAAIICVLSVFNGFKEITSGRLSHLSADVSVTPSQGKAFSDADSILSLVRAIPGVQRATPVVSDNALVIANNRETPVRLMGVVAPEFRKVTAVDSTILEGGSYDISFDKTGEDASHLLLSIGTAMNTGALIGEEITLFVPRRYGRLNPANPLASLNIESASCRGVFQTQHSEYDANTVICDIETARTLFDYGTEATSIEISAAPGTSPERLASDIESHLGKSVTAKDRLRQQEMYFRMSSIEKWVSFLLLIFILIIASFNIISSMSMLIIEKQRSMSTLHSLGMSKRRVGRIFFWQSIFVCMIGGAAGIGIGALLCLLQQKYGFLKLSADPTALSTNVYPVALHLSDVLATAAIIVMISAATGAISAAFARSRIKVAANS